MLAVGPFPPLPPNRAAHNKDRIVFFLPLKNIELYVCIGKGARKFRTYFLGMNRMSSKEIHHSYPQKAAEGNGWIRGEHGEGGDSLV